MDAVRWLGGDGEAQVVSVWFAIPSARPLDQVSPILAAWRAKGYKVALLRDGTLPYMPGDFADNVVTLTEYPGYAQAVNLLAKLILKADEECDWIVSGGDDTYPDPNHTADEIAEECTRVFTAKVYPDHIGENKSTFGVMQPTGDRYAGGCIDRIAGSPWLGREWCLRANQGKGPFWPEFTHMFSDECLKRTAEKLGVYWARPDLIHLHKHFQRESDAINSRAVQKPVPPHLVKWNTKEHWNEMKAIFKRLEAEDFKSCMPL